jgi:preprotein translocase subunit SecG
MQHVIIVIHLMLVLALIGVVLLQRSEGGGLGIGSTGGFMTSRGTANVLTRATAILAGLFFRHQPVAFDPGRYQPQTDLGAAGRAECAGSTGRADPAREWWWRVAQSAARWHAACRSGGSRGALRAAGATVKMKSLAKGRELRPFTVEEPRMEWKSA